MKKLKIKNGDSVQVITGDDKGKTGTVLAVDPDAMKIRVQGVRIQTKRDKKENTLIKEEGWMDYSNVKMAGAAKGAATKKKKKSTKKAAAKA